MEVRTQIKKPVAGTPPDASIATDSRETLGFVARSREANVAATTAAPREKAPMTLTAYRRKWAIQLDIQILISKV